MKYFTPGEISKNEDYLLIGYVNNAGQLDVAKLSFSLLDNYYISSEIISDLSSKIDQLSTFVYSCLELLSSNAAGKGNKITVPELSAYCSYSRYNEMKSERTFVTSTSFMNQLCANFKLRSQVSSDTKLLDVGKPLSLARDRITGMFDEAFTPKEED